MINNLSPVKLINFSSRKNKQTAKPQKSSAYYTQEPVVSLTGNVYNIKINKPKLDTPLDILCYQATEGRGVQYDAWSEEHLYQGFNRPDKKWVVTEPKNVLNRTLEDAINSNLTLVCGENIPKNILSNITTPNYGDNWGRHANYIEINNRAIANMEDNRTNSSILNTIKLMPLIPPSHDRWANCLLISQLYPNIWGDGWNNNGENSIYGIKLENERLSDNIGYQKIGNRYFTPEEQVQAFNDIAHLRGFKTSFRMLISADQIRFGDSGQFFWPKHDDTKSLEENQKIWDKDEYMQTFIAACCKGIKLGFDGIFFDSIKHVGGFEKEYYLGSCNVPSEEQMKYIFRKIRENTRKDVCFSGEKATENNYRYTEMGLNAGAGWADASNIDEIKRGSWEQTNQEKFACGPIVTDDNDGIHYDPVNHSLEYTEPMKYEDRLSKIKGCLYGYGPGVSKLPTFMQMADLFPLNHSTCTHQLMMENKNFSSDGTSESHYNNLFADDEDAKKYRQDVINEFAYCYNYCGQ